MSNVQITQAAPSYDPQDVTLIPVQPTYTPPGEDALEEINVAQESSIPFFNSWKWTAAKMAGVVLALAFIHQAGVHTGTYHTSSLVCEALEEKQACIKDLAQRSLETMPLINDGVLSYINQAAMKALALGSSIVDTSLTTVNILGNVAWAISWVADHPIKLASFSLFGYFAGKPTIAFTKEVTKAVLGKAGTKFIPVGENLMKSTAESGKWSPMHWLTKGMVWVGKRFARQPT